MHNVNNCDKQILVTYHVDRFTYAVPFSIGSNLLIFYKANGAENFKARALTSDGLAFTGNEYNIVISNIFGAQVNTSWHFKHENMDYLLFSTGGTNLRVAGSINGTLGPYEAHTDILVPGNYWDPCLVKDVDNVNDVIVFGSKNDIFAASIDWQSIWPVVTNFTITNLYNR